MKSVPKKNVGKDITDIRHPESGSPSKNNQIQPEPEVKPEEAVKIFGEPPRGGEWFGEKPGVREAKKPVRVRFYIFALLGLAVVWLSFLFLVSSYRSRSAILGSAALGLEQFQAGIDDLKSFNPESAQEKFITADGTTSVLPQSFFSMNNFNLIISGAGQAFKNFQSLTSQAVVLTKNISDLRASWEDFVFRRDGGKLIANLEAARNALSNISDKNSELTSGILKFKDILPVDFSAYLPIQLDIDRLKGFFDALIVWLKSPSDRHLVLFLENNSEMRPGGGFIGSYVDVVVRDGNLQALNVHDINDSDRELELKTVPPKPLQALVKNWRAADANWFFDFSESAAKVTEFMEASDIYKKNSVIFDGAVGVSPKVISDVLSIAGPISLSGNIKINQDNFLIEIQKRVEYNREKKISDPKGILDELAPLLLDKLSNLEEEKKNSVYKYLGEWLKRKDLVFYFKDPAFQNFFDYYNLTGRVADLSENANVDYLAVASANIGGAKTDLYLKQKVTLQSQIGEDGTVNSHLLISREHQGQKSSYWWYREPSQSYIKIFTAPASKMESMKGGFIKKITPAVDYKVGGYAVDPRVQAVESTEREYLGYPAIKSYEEYGRNVFALWAKLDRGKKEEIIVDYSRKLPLPIRENQSYRFIFDKQPGSRDSYKFEINAPIGFKWLESNLPVFDYESDNPDGRVVIDLTLVRI